MDKALKESTQSRMSKSLEALKKELGGLRTGRASIDLLKPVEVDAYGSMTPLNQVANVAVSDARLLTVQVWDKSMVAAVEKAIRDAGLGLNPATEGQVIRVPLPELNTERRLELTKIARKYGEEGRVAVRNVRRDAMDQIKKQQKDGDISEDDAHRTSDEIQKLTDDFVSKIDVIVAEKEKEIEHV